MQHEPRQSTEPPAAISVVLSQGSLARPGGLTAGQARTAPAKRRHIRAVWEEGGERLHEL